MLQTGLEIIQKSLESNVWPRFASLVALAEPGRKLTVRMRCLIVYLPCWFRLYHPTFQWLLAMTQKRASLDCMIEFTGPNGHKNVRLKSNYPSIRLCRVINRYRFLQIKSRYSERWGLMERNGHFAREIETWGNFGLGVWRDWTIEIEASCPLPVSPTEERVQWLEKGT